MTQSALARAVGVSTRTIQSYEMGQSYPKHRDIYGALSRVLGCEQDYLMTEGDLFITSSGEQFSYREQRARKSWSGS